MDPVPAATPAADVSVTPFYLDKGLYVAILAPVLMWLNQKFGLELDPTAIVAMLLPIAAYVIGHKWKSGTIAVAQIAAASAAASPAGQLNK